MPFPWTIWPFMMGFMITKGSTQHEHVQLQRPLIILKAKVKQSKKGGKEQELIQSSTTSDLTQDTTTGLSYFPRGNNKVADHTVRMRRQVCTVVIRSFSGDEAQQTLLNKWK